MTRDERQQLIIENWKKAKCRASVVACTGFGKTRTALTAICRVLDKNPNISVTIVVPTKVLKDQWLEALDKIGLINEDIEVLIINTAAKKPFICDFLIIDECQHISAEGMSNVFRNCKPILILGLTATYERLDQREKKVLDYFAPVCDEVTFDEALENGWIAPYTEYKVVLDVDRTEYDKYNAEFLKFFAFFNYDFNLAMACMTSVFKQQQYAKLTGFSTKDVQACAYGFNKALKFRKSFVANHPKKLEIAKKIIAARQGSKIITFNGSIKQCEAYKNGYILHSGNTKKKNQMTVEEFSLCKEGVLHTSKMADEGLDIRGLNVAIITGFNSSKISHRQRVGRVVRFEPGKKAEVFSLVLKNTVESNWYNKSMEGLNYVEIDEDELDKVLNTRTLHNKKIKKQEKVNNKLLRF